MKKIIFLTISLLLTFFNVEAKEIYYSEYSDYTNFDDKKIVSDELNDVLMENRYKFYKEEKVNEEYTLLNKDRIYDLNDYIYTDYSDWGTNNNIDGAEYQFQTLYHYQDMEEVRYIYFDDIYGSNEVLRLAEIKAFSKDVQIPYEFHCSGCRNNTYSKITDGITEQNAAYVINGERMYLDLLKTYPVDSLKIELYLYDISTETKTYSMHITNVLDGDSFYTNKFYQNFQNDDFSTIFPFIHTYKDLNINKPLWKDWQITFQPTPATDTRKVEMETLSRYRYKLYKHYDIVKTYLNDYYLEHEGYIKDDSQTKTYYKKRSRDKLEIEDLKIIDKETNIEDLISSTINYEIIGEIDYNKNGIYNVEIKTPFITIEKTVEIDIYENELKQLEEQNKNLKQIVEAKEDATKKTSKTLETINNQLNEKNKELEEIKKNYQEQIKKYEDIIQENTNKSLSSLEQLQLTHNIEKSNLNSEIENYISKINELNYAVEKNNLSYKQVVQEYKKSINEYQNELAKKTVKEKTITSSTVNSKNSLLLLIFVIIVLLIRNIKLNNRKM